MDTPTSPDGTAPDPVARVEDRTATPAPARRERRRLERSVAGRTYHLSLATLYRRPVFDDADAARAVARLHAAAWAWRDARVLAWVLLPDAWEALLVLGQRDTLCSLVGRFKALSSRAVEERHRVNGWLWGRGFRERVLVQADGAEAEARALVQAPVQRGLAARPGDYPWWDSAWRPPPGWSRRSTPSASS